MFAEQQNSRLSTPNGAQVGSTAPQPMISRFWPKTVPTPLSGFVGTRGRVFTGDPRLRPM